MRRLNVVKWEPTEDLTAYELNLYLKWVNSYKVGKFRHSRNFKLWMFDDPYYWYVPEEPPPEIERHIVKEYKDFPDEPMKVAWYKKLI